MKAEHRKELQTNALADRLGRFFKGVRSGKAPSSIKIWVVALVLVAGILGTWWYLRSAAAKNRSARWVGVAQATDDAQLSKPGLFGPTFSEDAIKKAEQKLNDIIEKNPGTRAAVMASFQLAQLHLRVMGLDRLAMTTAGSAPLDNIKKASDEYEELAKQWKDDPFWGPQALLGQAKAAEARAVQDVQHLDKAAKLYAELAHNYPESAAGQEAAKRSKELQDPAKRKDVDDFYLRLGRRLSFDTRPK